MTAAETITLAVQQNPGKTAGELGQLLSWTNAKIGSALTTSIKRGYIVRKRRLNSTRYPNIGLWEYHP